MENTLLSDIKNCVDTLCSLNNYNPLDKQNTLDYLLNKNVESFSKLNLPTLTLQSDTLENIKKLNGEDVSIEWRYIVTNFHYLFHLSDILTRHKKAYENLSVQQAQKLENVLKNVIAIGIASNLAQKMPYHLKLNRENEGTLQEKTISNYKRLIGTLYGCFHLANSCVTLRSLIIPKFLKWILCAFYQILFCPLIKPNEHKSTENEFVMSESMYKSLLIEREMFTGYFKTLSSRIYRVVHIRETMMLASKTSPLWLKKAVSTNLTQQIISPGGVEAVAGAMLDAVDVDDQDDSTKSWNILEVIIKIITEAYKLPEFRLNLSKQLLSLLKIRDGPNKPHVVLERIFILCTKQLYKIDRNLCKDVLIEGALSQLVDLTGTPPHLINQKVDITEPVFQAVRILCSLIAEDRFSTVVIPFNVVSKFCDIIFRLLVITISSNHLFLAELNLNLKLFISKCLQEHIESDYSIFDALLFGLVSKDILPFQNKIRIELEHNTIIAQLTDYKETVSSETRSTVLKSIIKPDASLQANLFSYLLYCLINRQKYLIPNDTHKPLLDLEQDFILTTYTERNLVILQLLSELAEDKNIEKHILENPGRIISYMSTVLDDSVKNNEHLSSNQESDEYQTIFLMIMILQSLTEGIPEEKCKTYSSLIVPIKRISEECCNRELSELSKKVYSKLSGNACTGDTKETDDKQSSPTTLDLAIEDICDPILPIRGHGLMTLKKLIEKRDESAMERKQYILNIFQQNIKDTDSYIYLTAIDGLAAMGTIFTDRVLNILSEEYSDFSKREFTNKQEIRMKLGEVLVRVTKTLGDMAPKYKALLLNTFLSATKDDDHLIRASSLSNLGEICRVLGYKLGTTVTEILVCVHAIVTTDKAPEARRAAVTVLRQLFMGLDKDMIIFLKDEILPIYRSLKQIYSYDKDDVMKLQAQLALEQLNVNVCNALTSSPVLNLEKKHIVLK